MLMIMVMIFVDYP